MHHLQKSCLLPLIACENAKGKISVYERQLPSKRTLGMNATVQEQRPALRDLCLDSGSVLSSRILIDEAASQTLAATTSL